MKKIKIGIFGCGVRGCSLAGVFMLLNCDIVAACDSREKTWADMRKTAGDGVTLYRDFDAFIKHDMDAVVLANFFHEHAPYAIRCFEKGLHVFSECISNGTMAEGVALVRAFQKSSSVYMLAENYPQMLFNREMKRICDSGTLGKILYAEGEYNHPGDPMDIGFSRSYSYYEKHWRHYLPRTYYITHSMGPVMWATGATPKRVTAFACYAPQRGDVPTASANGDRAAIVTTQNDDDSVFRVTGCAAFGGHHNAYRICGTKGQIENLRGLTPQVMLRYNGWEIPEGAKENELYTPKWNDADEELIVKSGHGGGDYLTARMFLDCVRSGKQPEHPFDIYAATVMSSVAILAHRSVLAGGAVYDVPDFRHEEDCLKYENDHETPFYSEKGEPTLSCCSDPDYRPTEAQLALYRKAMEQ